MQRTNLFRRVNTEAQVEELRDFASSIDGHNLQHRLARGGGQAKLSDILSRAPSQ